MYCNKCGKEISQDTKFCNYCGTQIIDNQSKNDNSKPKKKKKFYQKWWVWLIIVLLVLIIIGINGSDNTNNTISTPNNSVNTNSNKKNNSDTKTEKIEYITVNIDELEDALEENAASAKDKYLGKNLKITGRLGVIDSDLKYIGLYSTTDKWDLVGVHCTIKSNEQKEKIKKLKKDDTIIVKGKITNVGEILGYSLDIEEISKK